MKKRSKMRQQNLPGTQPAHHADVSSAAEELAGSRDDVKEAQDAEVAAHKKLVGLMKEKKLTSYLDRGLGLRVFLKHRDASDKIAIKKIDQNKDVEP